MSHAPPIPPKLTLSQLAGDPPDSLVVNVRIFAGIMIGIPTIAVALRFWARWVVSKKKYWWDDWILLLSLIFSNACNAMMVYWTYRGLGVHLLELPYPVFSQGMLAYEIAAIFHQWSAAAFRTAAILLYYRVFVRDSAVRHKRFEVGLWVCLGFTVAYLIISTFFLIFQCNPPRKVWDPRYPGSCVQLKGNLLGACSSAFILDFVITTLPIPVVWKLQMPRKKKLLLIGVIVLSYNVCLIALARVAYFAVITQALNSEFQQDFTYSFVPSMYIMTLETGVACFTLSIPPMYQLFQRVARNGFRSLITSHDSYHITGEKSSQGGFAQINNKVPVVRQRDDLEYQSAGGTSSRGGHEKLMATSELERSTSHFGDVNDSTPNITPGGDEEKQIAIAY